jgi:transposase
VQREWLDVGSASRESGRSDFDSKAWPGLPMSLALADRRFFPPAIATHLVKLACELPDQAGRSLSLWTCAELARTLRRDGLVESISPQSVQRILSSYRLKPWRVHHWLSLRTPRDEEFRRRTENVCDLYTRDLAPHERVLCVDEKTSLQPRPRTSATRPAKPGLPIHLEHEYERRGALQLFAALDTRSGTVIGICRRRKRQEDFIEFLETLDRDMSTAITLVHVVCDNLILHKGKKVQAWLAEHPRFRFHFTPVHCSWMNQIEQWFSNLQRKRLSAPNFSNLEELENRIDAFISEWNDVAHPFRWSPASFAKVRAKVETSVPAAA